MDAGVIRNLKHLYRKKLVSKQLNAMDERTVFNVDLRQGLISLKRSWDEMKSETIRNCFKHVGVHCEPNAEIDIDDPEGFVVEG